MGTSVQHINDNVSLIASADTWIESLAIQQLTKTAELTGMARVAGMPDLHPGRGYPVGAAFFSTHRIYPALVGSDIGCGMALWQTTTPLSKVNLDKFSKRFANIESPLDGSWRDYVLARKQQLDIEIDGYDDALGTIGGGNHFAEFQAISEVYDPACLTELGIDKRCLQLLVHSGSRGLGQAILNTHVADYNHDGLPVAAGGFDAYMAQHNEALRWAGLNRELIARRFLEAVRTNGRQILDVNHNLVSRKTIGSTEGWLHRKGATPADMGCVMIPGSRGDFSYLVKPKPAENPEISLYSLAHGAGRKWKRGDCHGRLAHKYKRDDLYRTELGSRVVCGDKTLLYDEAPQAYKNCSSVIADLVDAGLIDVIAKLKPVLTFKTNGLKTNGEHA